MANMLEGGGKTPILAPEELEQLGFKLVAYPLSLLGVSIRAMQSALQLLKVSSSSKRHHGWRCTIIRRMAERSHMRVGKHMLEAHSAPTVAPRAAQGLVACTLHYTRHCHHRSDPVKIRRPSEQDSAFHQACGSLGQVQHRSAWGKPL